MRKTWPDYMVTSFPVMFEQNFLFFGVSHMMKQCHSFVDTFRLSGSHTIPDVENLQNICSFVRRYACSDLAVIDRVFPFVSILYSF